MNLEVLFEDNHCLAVNKPAGLLSQADVSGEPSLVDAVTAYLKTRYAKPGNVYVGLLHRLDRTTSGVMLLAKTSKAAGRLSQQFRSGTISKLYWAVVEGRLPEIDGEWIDCARQGPPAKPGRRRAAGKRVGAGSSGRVPGRGGLCTLYPARASARNRAKPPASHSAREPGPTHPR